MLLVEKRPPGWRRKNCPCDAGSLGLIVAAYHIDQARQG